MKKLPSHVAVILDGNGRWAEKRGLMREKGHLMGASKVPMTVKHLFERGVETVSLYAFSVKNFSRPRGEVQGIFDRVEEFVRSFKESFEEGKVRIIFTGNLQGVGEELRRACEGVMEESKNNFPHTLNVLLNYGGRAEIVRAARLLYESGREITEDALAAELSHGLADPDLIIRTGGEKRLSDFMPFESAYAELYFTDVLFPDITEDHLDAALEEYSNRSRRFGNTKPTEE